MLEADLAPIERGDRLRNLVHLAAEVDQVHGLAGAHLAVVAHPLDRTDRLAVPALQLDALPRQTGVDQPESVDARAELDHRLVELLGVVGDREGLQRRDGGVERVHRWSHTSPYPHGHDAILANKCSLVKIVYGLALRTGVRT